LRQLVEIDMKTHEIMCVNIMKTSVYTYFLKESAAAPSNDLGNEYLG
jgi:hypothetical protein